MDPAHIGEQLVSNAPYVAALALMFWRTIKALGRRLDSVERKLERICDELGAEVTGRHSIPPRRPPRPTNRR